MKITKATLYTDNIEQMKQFYLKTLGFSQVSETDRSFAIQAGASVLEFELDPLRTPKQYHYAFNIPGNLFIEAKKWIKNHISLLLHEEEDEIFFENTNSHSVYFYDSDENVVELIARHAVNPTRPSSLFVARDILDIGEMNLTTDDVLGVGEKLEEIGVFQRYGSPLKGDSLNFLGEPQDGTHILLGPAGRNWLFSKKDAITSPIMIELNHQHRIQVDSSGKMQHELLATKPLESAFKRSHGKIL
ncbi:VOC family protein [Exiguobacterium flavidum]|uniref:VOC family protein n=1 Tax=Exiguobacterium flavidum TaxID=2184695 RepID=UPI000DF75A0A|nr:VOC family protein [Exiguobacterium flavidum]